MPDTPFDADALSWFDNPDGGGRFPAQRDAIRAHDPNCPGLAHVWLPRKGGVSCPSDLADCDTCGITFYWEGLITAFEDCPELNHWYCACCLAKTPTCGCTPGAPDA